MLLLSRYSVVGGWQLCDCSSIIITIYVYTCAGIIDEIPLVRSLTSFKKGSGLGTN